MKIGISRNTVGPEAAAELVNCAAECGFEGIQFKTSQLGAWEYDAGALDRIGDGVRARAMARGGVVFHPRADFSRWPELTRSVLKFATAAGSEHVCYCFNPEEKNGHTYPGVAEQLRTTGRQYAEHGIRFSFHNHTDSMMDTLAACTRLCDLLDPADCGLTFDTAHAAACGITDLGAAIEALKSHITNVHLKDLSTAGKFCPVGTGTLALADALAALQRIDYRDWMIVDEESADVTCPDACRISMDFLKQVGRTP